MTTKGITDTASDDGSTTKDLSSSRSNDVELQERLKSISDMDDEIRELVNQWSDRSKMDLDEDHLAAESEQSNGGANRKVQPSGFFVNMMKNYASTNDINDLSEVQRKRSKRGSALGGSIFLDEENVDFPVHKGQRSKTTDGEMKHKVVVGLLFLLKLALILFFVLPIVIIYGGRQNQMSGATTSWEWDLPFSVPDSTVAAIAVAQAANTTTPQSQAYEWVKNDPKLIVYSDERLQQRFALATFYYSTQGTSWNYQGGGTISFLDSFNIASQPWLSYDHTECKWFSTVFQGQQYPACPNSKHTLVNLIVTENNLRGNLPEELALLTALEIVDLSGNKIGGTLPSQIGTLDRLRILNLHSNKVSGSIPTELGLLSSSLALLRLHKNQLTGTFPPDLWQLAYLEELNFGDNDSMSGSFPTDLGVKMPNLKALKLERVEEWSGTLPTSIGLLSKLTSLHLHKNQITGALPTELGLATNLVELKATRNLLSGTLPTELSQLQHLDLGGNINISGTVPTEWNNMTDLKLWGTSVTGTIPDHLCEIDVMKFDCGAKLCGCGCSCDNSDA